MAAHEDPPLPIRRIDDGIELAVHVRPGGRHDAVEGRFDGVLAVRVSAAPTKGQANSAVERTVARALSVRPGAVSVAGGHTSRRKKLLVKGDQEVLIATVTGLLDGGR